MQVTSLSARNKGTALPWVETIAFLAALLLLGLLLQACVSQATLSCSTGMSLATFMLVWLRCLSLRRNDYVREWFLNIHIPSQVISLLHFLWQIKKVMSGSMISPSSFKMFYLRTNEVLKAWRLPLVPSTHCAGIGGSFILGFLPVAPGKRRTSRESYSYLSCGVGEYAWARLDQGNLWVLILTAQEDGSLLTNALELWGRACYPNF